MEQATGKEKAALPVSIFLSEKSDWNRNNAGRVLQESVLH